MSNEEKVKELVEWVAKQLYDEFSHSLGKHWDAVLPELKDGWIKRAKQILSHPDLALIDQTCYTYIETGKQLAYVFPLAPAIKEMEDEQ